MVARRHSSGPWHATAAAAATTAAAAAQAREHARVQVGVFAALAALVVDLADPFRGAYRITPTVAQLFPLREAFVADVCAQQGAADADRADRADKAARRPGTQ